MGGTLAEIYRDFVVRPAPVALDDALLMVDAVRAFALLRGYRRSAPGDRVALAHAVRRMSLLACIDGGIIVEAEINPLLVRAEGAGVVALDALLVIGPGMQERS